ncbi:XdhC family protein [Microvirga antarctica]|uniref:XdhC family protein n=1 Tax=Microvirga antarctica TaxID=2819233 RepID=UPI001B305301|nr:XdhC family protein [Microvirga antarctica]
MTSALEMAKADWHTFGLQDSVVPFLRDAASAGLPVALVTMVRAIGGPRGVGAQMAVTRDAVVGYLSGGCVEADVTAHALATLDDGAPRRLVYGQGGPVDIQLPCGGRIDLLVEYVPAGDASLETLLNLSASRQPALWLSDGQSRHCVASAGDFALVPPELFAARDLVAVTSAEAGSAGEDGPMFRWTFPARRLIVVGHDPSSLAIASLAQVSGYEVTLVRPKGPPAPPPVPGIAYRRDGPAEAFASVGLDPWTSVVVSAHNDDDDHDALLASLPSRACYVGLLGSRRHLARKLARLRSDGVGDVALARLKAPIGLPIGARSSWEIATSVMSEVIQESSNAAARGLSSLATQAA